MRPHAQRARNAFTIVEVAVVLSALSILAVAVFLLRSTAPDQCARMAARELAAHLRYAQRLAVARERTTRFAFDVAANSYAVSIADTNAPGGYAPLKDPVTQEDWNVAVADRFPGVELATANINGNNVLYFAGTNGIPWDIFRVPLSGPGTVSFRSGIAIEIAVLTGYVTVSD
jgi:prepilin-type N-terminal cleavage/methylation domain-containing protein